jgi:hypothetical protein
MLQRRQQPRRCPQPLVQQQVQPLLHQQAALLVRKKGETSAVQTVDVWSKAAILYLLVGIVVTSTAVGYLLFSHSNSLGSDAALGRTLSVDVAAELGDASLADPDEGASDRGVNPWAGSSRRARTDMIVSRAGCGGEYVRAAAVGDSVRLRYFVRDGDLGNVAESTRGRPPVDVVIGARQVDARLEQALVGVCAGESFVVLVSDWMTVAVIAVVSSGRRGDDESNGAEVAADEENDRVAGRIVAVAGRRGASCSATCRAAGGLECSAVGFAVVNTCPRLRAAFGCAGCEVAATGTAGADMPCYVSRRAPAGHPRGFCMVRPAGVDRAEGGDCEARYRHTRRLCPCVGPAV